MGMFRGVVAVGVLAVLSGCGAYDDFKANTAVQDQKLAFFVNNTNDCESMLVDTNIVMLELARSNIEREKDSIVQVVGKDGFEQFSKTANKLIDGLIEQQEEKRPGFFARLFLGEGQPFKDTRNQLFNISDMHDLRSAVLERISAGKAVTATVPAKPVEPMTGTETILLGKQVSQTPVPVPLSAPVAVAQPVAPVVQAQPAVPSELSTSADRMIASEIAQDGGDEYKDARQIFFADLNNDGTQDAVVLYTIEGQGGGNGYFQSLAAFMGSPSGWHFSGKAVVGNGVQNIQVVNSQTLSLKVLTVGPEDPDCCPSVESTEIYKWDGSTFIQTPTS
jgi:hypothetical protein